MTAVAPRSSKRHEHEPDLFSQQLEMYASLGRNEGQQAANAKAKTEAEFMALLSAYISGTEPKDFRAFLPSQPNTHRHAPNSSADASKRHVTSPALKPADSPSSQILHPRIISRVIGAFDMPTTPPNNASAQQRQYRIDVPATTYTEARSQRSNSSSALHSPQAAPEDDLDFDQRSSLGSADDNNDAHHQAGGVKWSSENGFDVVFQQQSMGMKLGYDAVKKCAIVKECFDGTESKKYKQITNGVAIVSVNGQSLCGISLSKIMSRLREAQRPAVIRFETAEGGSSFP